MRERSSGGGAAAVTAGKAWWLQGRLQRCWRIGMRCSRQRTGLPEQGPLQHDALQTHLLSAAFQSSKVCTIVEQLRGSWEEPEGLVGSCPACVLRPLLVNSWPSRSSTLSTPQYSVASRGLAKGWACRQSSRAWARACGGCFVAPVRRQSGRPAGRVWGTQVERGALGLALEPLLKLAAAPVAHPPAFAPPRGRAYSRCLLLVAGASSRPCCPPPAAAASLTCPFPLLPAPAGKAGWIAGTSFLILVVPLIIEMDREQQVGAGGWLAVGSTGSHCLHCRRAPASPCMHSSLQHSPRSRRVHCRSLSSLSPSS